MKKKKIPKFLKSQNKIKTVILQKQNYSKKKKKPKNFFVMNDKNFQNIF